jgi:outer membrane protein TolC
MAVSVLAAVSLRFSAGALADGPGPVAGDPVEVTVKNLVAEALSANLELEEAGASVDQRIAALDQSRARFRPTLDFSARNTRAGGGRVVDIPTGNLLNPVYGVINELNGNERFRPVPNEQIDFQRHVEEVTGVTLTQPLYDARISAARAAAGADLEAAMADRQALARRVERDMRTAYYQWLAARTQVDILAASLELARENSRVSASLRDHGKVTADLADRADADRLEVEQMQLSARNEASLAQSYINLLRNAPFDRDVPFASVADSDIARLRADCAARGVDSSDPVATLQDAAVARRPELRGLHWRADAAEANQRLARSAFKPRLALVADGGIQGTDYGTTSYYRYWVASLVVHFSLYAGGADEAGVAVARDMLRQIRTEEALNEQRIRFEVQRALQNLELAQASVGTAARRVEAADSAFQIMVRRRSLGRSSQIDFIDARRMLTDSQLNLNVTRFNVLAALADLEYATGPGQLAGPAAP